MNTKGEKREEKGDTGEENEVEGWEGRKKGRKKETEGSRFLSGIF